MSGSRLHEFVRQRAAGCCEYCQLPQFASAIPFEIDHVIARKHDGLTEESNLALSCWYCNSAKGPCVGGVESDTGDFIRLFHPRRDSWDAHFAWEGAVLVDLSSVGRVTIRVLQINDPYLLSLRASLIDENEFPPASRQP